MLCAGLSFMHFAGLCCACVLSAIQSALAAWYLCACTRTCEHTILWSHLFLGYVCHHLPRGDSSFTSIKSLSLSVLSLSYRALLPIHAQLAVLRWMVPFIFYANFAKSIYYWLLIYRFCSLLVNPSFLVVQFCFVFKCYAASSPKGQKVTDALQTHKPNHRSTATGHLQTLKGIGPLLLSEHG